MSSWGGVAECCWLLPDNAKLQGCCWQHASAAEQELHCRPCKGAPGSSGL